jgi:tRNA (guanine37-N1)-methyltransferase
MPVKRLRNKTNVNLDPTTWSSILQEAVKAEELKVIPFSLKLDYTYWTYRMYSELPVAGQQELT